MQRSAHQLALGSTGKCTRQHWERTVQHCRTRIGQHDRTHWSAMKTSFTYLQPHCLSALISIGQHWEMHLAALGTHWAALHCTHWAQSVLISTGNLICIFTPTLVSTRLHWEMCWSALGNALVSTAEHTLVRIVQCTGQHWKPHLHICTRNGLKWGLLNHVNKNCTYVLLFTG